MEAVCFIPFTSGSGLKRQLLEMDNILSEALGAPEIHFVDRGGRSILNQVGSSNPREQKEVCGRSDCGVC